MKLARSGTDWLAGHAGRVPPATGCCRRARRPLAVSALGALLALLVPKCPLCLATYLSFLGAAATGVVWLRPVGVALMLAGASVAAWRTLARRLRRDAG